MNYCTQLHPDQQEDMEDIPNQFDEGAPALSSQYQSNNNNLYSRVSQLLANRGFINKTNSKGFFHKNNKKEAERIQKLNGLKQQQQNRILADCTFHPQVNKSRSKSTRNIKDFLESQQKHLQRIHNKNQLLKKTIEAQNKKSLTFSPQINPKSKKRNKQNVYQRLYRLKDKQNHVKQSHLIEEWSHTPKISKRSENIVRAMPIDELLYEDAKRRAQKIHNIQQAPPHQVNKNYNQEKYVAQKLLKDFKNALDTTFLKEKLVYNEEELMEVLKEMGYACHYIYPDSSLGLEERQLLHHCYQYLEQFGVSQINLYVFLLALGGIYNVDLNNEELANVMVIDQVEGRKIHHYFDFLFRNRLSADTGKRPTKSVQGQCSYKPSINNESEVLASRYRCKMIEKTNSIFESSNIGITVPEKGLSHGDLLVIHSLGQNLQKERRRNAKKNENDPECTFQPNAQKHSRQLISQEMLEDRCISLYEYARSKQQKGQNTALPTFRTNDAHSPSKGSPFNSQSPIVPRKQKSQFTPKESISGIKTKMNSYLEVRDADKALSRMIRGRQQRQQKRQLTERGELPVKRTVSKNKPKHQEISREMLLEADVLVGLENRKIYIYRGEEDMLEQIVNIFCKQCGLDQQNREMLLEHLEQALKSL